MRDPVSQKRSEYLLTFSVMDFWFVFFTFFVRQFIKKVGIERFLRASFDSHCSNDVVGWHADVAQGDSVEAIDQKPTTSINLLIVKT